MQGGVQFFVGSQVVALRHVLDAAVATFDRAVCLGRFQWGNMERGAELDRPMTWQAFETLPKSSARFGNPVLWVMILSVVFNIVVCCDRLVRTAIKTGNHYLVQEMRRAHSNAPERARCQITSRRIQFLRQ